MVSAGWTAFAIAVVAFVALIASYVYGDPWGYVSAGLAATAALVAIVAVLRSPRMGTAALAALALIPLGLFIVIFYLASKST